MAVAAAAAAAAATVVDVVIVIVRDSPSGVCSLSCVSTEGVAVVGAGSGKGPTAESLSGARAGQDVVSNLGLGFVLGFCFGLVFGLGFGLVFGLGFGLSSELFDSESFSLGYLLFLEILLPLFIFLFSVPPLPVIFSISAVVITT